MTDEELDVREIDGGLVDVQRMGIFDLPGRGVGIAGMNHDWHVELLSQLVVIFSGYIGRAFQTTLWPFLGFLFMPLTTLAYGWAINSRGSVAGVHLVLVVVAVLIDLGLIGGSASRRGAAPPK